jgi:hypothetical protein
VAYLLKAKPVETRKQPLLAKCSETTFVSRQRLSKHVPAAMDTHATEERFFLRWPYRGVIRKTIGSFCKEICEEEISVGRKPPFRKDLSLEAAIIRNRYQEILICVL